MKHFIHTFRQLLFVTLSVTLFCYCGNNKEKETKIDPKVNNFFIGWAAQDITPDKPVLIHGQFPARISEGIMDPVTVSALVLEYRNENQHDKVLIISCDLAIISSDLLDTVRQQLKKSLPDLLPENILISATHTHSGPQYDVKREVRKELLIGNSASSDIELVYGIDMEAMQLKDVMTFITDRIVKASELAWQNRKPGGISYGLGHAVVSHNRLQSDLSGKSQMYGNTNRPEFSHIEGYEDHSVNLLYTWDEKSYLTGVVINIAAPSQVSEHAYKISADYWHDVRVELRKRLGENIFILTQCSTAGDQSPHIMIGSKAEERMQKLMFPEDEAGRGSMGRRKQIATRISDAVTSVLPYMKDNIDWEPVLRHQMEEVHLSRRLISIEDVEQAVREGDEWKEKYLEMLEEINNNPELKQKPRWYTGVTSAYRRMNRGYNVKERYELEKIQPKMPVEVHVIRIGDIVLATNPFEYYLDYGMRIKAQSPAVQTFLVQLTGPATYVPTNRSIAGGAYGAVPASTLIGPEGGQELMEKTLEMINEIMK